MESACLNPAVVLLAFLAIVYGLYHLAGRIAPLGEETPGKRQPYACGEDLVPPRARLAYHTFFWLALMFGILHLSALVISTLPREGISHWMAFAYLAGIGVSVFVLTQGES